ncbi:MAG: hypothetical protein ABJB69_04920 [Spartobacteria bacterium]
MGEELRAMGAKIDMVLSVQPQYFVTHPSELRALRQLSDADLRQFAQERGWRSVRRVGGRQIEFYNDVSMRGV